MITIPMFSPLRRRRAIVRLLPLALATLSLIPAYPALSATTRAQEPALPPVALERVRLSLRSGKAVAIWSRTVMRLRTPDGKASRCRSVPMVLKGDWIPRGKPLR